MEDNHGCTWLYMAKRVRSNETRRPIDDWESFLYTISSVLEKDWFKPRYDNINRKNTIVYEDESLRSVISAFANEVFTDDVNKRFPNYDYFYHLICVEIAKKHKKNNSKFPSVFTWLSNSEKQRAKDEFDANLVPKIEDIDEPSLINFDQFNYPVVDDLFEIDSDDQERIPDPNKSKKSSKSNMCCFA